MNDLNNRAEAATTAAATVALARCSENGQMLFRNGQARVFDTFRIRDRRDKAQLLRDLNYNKMVDNDSFKTLDAE